MSSRALFAFLILSSCAHRNTIGGIRFESIHHGSSNRRYFHVHGNESTARELLIEHMKSHKGTAFIVKSEKRMVPLGALDVDPNRMFSDDGVDRNLHRVNRDPSEAAVVNARIDLNRDRRRFVDRILPPVGGLLIALHNNSATYSVADEVPISDQVSLADQDHPHEFMLATSVADFQIMRRSPFNVVLQQKAPPADDGSLSRLCAKLGVRYVNIEAGQGQYGRQKQMLDWLEQNLP